MTTTMMNCVELNNEELELVNGGIYDVGPQILMALDLDDIVHHTGGWTDTYYDTYRGDGVWKNVGLEDMIRYVERTLGSSDPRYKALHEVCNKGATVYNGKKIVRKRY